MRGFAHSVLVCGGRDVVGEFIEDYNCSEMPHWPTIRALAQRNQELFLTRQTGLNWL